jgi:hypothetical protein
MDFPFPMFLTTWHMCLATILTQMMSRYTNMLPGVREVRKFVMQNYLAIFFINLQPLLNHYFSQNKVTLGVLRNQILPVALFFSISLIFSNKAYIYLSVSYIQVRLYFTIHILLYSVFSKGG